MKRTTKRTRKGLQCSLHVLAKGQAKGRPKGQAKGPRELAYFHSPCIPEGSKGTVKLPHSRVVTYARQGCILVSVIRPVTLYIWQPLFLMHSLLRGISAMPSKTGFSFALVNLVYMDRKIFYSYYHMTHKSFFPSYLDRL